jgi:hypothetical protein
MSWAEAFLEAKEDSSPMNAQIPKPEWQRIENWLIWIAVLGAALLLLAPLATGLEQVVPVDDKELSQPTPQPAPRQDGLPFTAWDVVQYFSTVLEMAPEKEKGGALVFENPQPTFPEDRWRIEIWAERKSVVVQFTAGGEYGMSLAREFFECPIFEQSESEQFYDMFSRAKAGPLTRMHRFTVSMAYKETSDLEVLVMKFTAPSAALTSTSATR